MTIWEVVEPVISLMTAVSSVAVASIVGGAVIQSQRDQRAHNRLSVRPILHAWTHTNYEKQSAAFVLMNRGLGPGVIQSIRFIRKNHNGDFFGMEELKYYMPLSPIEYSVSVNPVSLAVPHAVLPGNDLKLLELTFERNLGNGPLLNNEIDDFMRVVLDEFEVEIIYQCMYGNYFRYFSGGESGGG